MADAINVLLILFPRYDSPTNRKLIYGVYISPKTVLVSDNAQKPAISPFSRATKTLSQFENSLFFIRLDRYCPVGCHEQFFAYIATLAHHSVSQLVNILTSIATFLTKAISFILYHKMQKMSTALQQSTSFDTGGGEGSRTPVRKSLAWAFSECSRSFGIPLTGRRKAGFLLQ